MTTLTPSYPGRIDLHSTEAPEIGQVSIRPPADGSLCMVPLAEIRPAPENDRLYRPVSAADPEILALAQSIHKHGLREPLVLTRDYVVLSGHRRRVACGLAGLTEVPCRVEDVVSSDPDFVVLLREHNRQRVKTRDEIAREEVVSANPEEAYRSLVEHRKAVSRVDVDLEVIQIEGVKHRAKITAAKQPMLDAILAVLRDRREFLPLTLRQVHYALLNDPPLKHASKTGSRYGNDLQSYKSLSDLLTRARFADLIPWEAIEDGTRPIVTWSCHLGLGPFIRGQIEDFLKGYYRDLQQSQPNHIEIIGEKNTVAGIIEPVASQFCIPYTLGRGYCSAPPRRAMDCRFRASGKEKLILLFLSDFDPEGEDIGHSFARSMRDDFGIENIEPIKVGLTADQVLNLNLPPQMTAKAKSSRRKKFVERHGENVFELEAVHPRQLQNLLRQAIDSVLDVAAFNAEVDAEREDAVQLDRLRRRVHRALAECITPE